MTSRNGSAIIYVVLAILVFGTIMSYIYASTTDSQINQLMQIQEIKYIYEKDVNSASSIYQGYIDEINTSLEE